ncbi:MAG: 2-(1,2-epoxy-1,2-dihydrophenyl)acetyl-CoA isomerase [Bacteroidetes bacterium]|nr:2-(1,2-epoxy-1,2-dihydrophenyl)acetyl-CoA isomerase [Bacteroidota bacterium]MBS1739291.1 2-(1,2-epoxy-1,2-dihydrophenyl)acetyl-CoA isomerase [Bacteroidota bacterium]
MSTIIFTIKDGVAYLQLNRTEKFNSFNREMSLELQRALDDCENNEDVRCIVLSGAGKAFCAGQDLAEATAPDGPELERIVAEHYNPIITKIRQIEKPIIAAVNGVAAGAGANIALACDIVVASTNASFIQAFSKIGLIPDSGGTFFLPRLIGLQRASALMFTAEKIAADDALQMGMVYKVFADESFLSETQKLATSLAQMPTKGIGLTKRLLNESFNNNLSQQLEREKQMQVKAGQTHDFKEGVAAFLEKRNPVFKGK